MQLKRTEKGNIEIVNGKKTVAVIQETADGVSLKDNIQRMSALYCVPKAKRKAMTESIVKRLQGTYGPFDEDSQEETELAG